MPAVSNSSILFLATDGFEDSELTKPFETLKARGARVTLAAPEAGEITGVNGTTVTADAAIGDVDPADYDGLVLPGGTKNPDALRMDARAVAIVRAFADAGKPVAAICHGPWLLVEADVIRGRTVTGWPSIRTDLRNAGATVVDREAVTDGNIVTSRKPEDIPAFTEAFARLLEDAPVAAAV